MQKSESLQTLDMLGLNTIDYFITKDKAEATHYLAKHVHERRSMRTERGGEFGCPFYYDLPGAELLPRALQHLDEGYKLIFSPSLAWQDSIAFGSIAIVLAGDDIIEFVHGPGLCRDLEKHPGKQSIILPGGSIAPILASQHQLAKDLNLLYKLIKDHCYELAPCIVEFSYYPYRVGKLSKHFICWELRGYNK